ncbi:hypothetical protein FHQ18_02440 [Deferribacter autotrophicus]|uniref:Lipoprotein n=1 Tax=Deferribacter autotrophicus TaxID=500465 RepID=A0A5A8F4F5_9BACT|nr:hypothetical protein [Deferribacter autotrophicus]KAA0258827.1 hypothetical protein FHQ18_02440 [Deferribacter autotrophicus]
MIKTNFLVFFINNIKKFAIYLIIFLLLGCVSKKIWTKPGLTQEEWERDKAQCIYEAQKATVGTYGFEIPMLVESCLKAKGYTPVKQ